MINRESLDSEGTQVELRIPLSQDESLELTLTKEKYNSLSKTARAELRAVEAKGYFVLKVMRILKGHKQADMAKMLGISVKCYQRRESRYNNADFAYADILIMHKEFKMSIEALFRTCQRQALA
ncbi:hypothetical protein [Desulfosporosinus acidiphilus]|uniref:hypothetical protein n=1 Tax=Desulfosporosinus acidiphilus TaxID=885581 RepID=UPI0011D2734B|nr:hypothetical protein [Desulfosporosinus acidiphilus]